MTSNGFRFRVDAAGVLTVYSGGVTSATTIELKPQKRQPDSDEVPWLPFAPGAASAAKFRVTS